MDTKQVILELRTQKGMSQDELAEKVFVSRQAVSRWENGETVPNTETLKLLSKVFDVSINTLLGSPRKLICQCCGMPLEDDDIIGHNHDGSFNEDYCKWCYADGIRRIIRDCNDEQFLHSDEPDVLLPHFSCHSLRHTFTTRMCEAGVNIKVIQDALGHSDISTTLNIYADVTKEMKAEEFKGLDSYFKV